MRATSAPHKLDPNLQSLSLPIVKLLTAAVAAGMPCVLVPSLPENLLDQTVVAKAVLKLTSLEQFLPEKFGLPAYA